MVAGTAGASVGEARCESAVVDVTCGGEWWMAGRGLTEWI